MESFNLQELHLDIPDGLYPAKMSGYNLTIYFDGKEKTIQMPFGVRGMNVPGEVIVSSGRVYLRGEVIKQ